MKLKFKFPPLAFEVAIFVIMVLVGWAAYRSYNIERLVERSSRELQETKLILPIYGALKLKEEYLTIALELAQDVKALHGTLEELIKPKELAAQSELKKQFDRGSQDLKKLIDRQKDRVKLAGFLQEPPVDNSKVRNEDQKSATNEVTASLSTVEKIFEEIEDTYTNYITHAKLIGQYTGRLRTRAPVEEELSNAQKEKEELLKLASRIGAAGESIHLHRRSLPAWAPPLQRKLQRLLLVLVVALMVLLVFGIYRQRVVGPLRLKIHSTKLMFEHQRKLDHFALFAKDLVHEIRNPLTSMNARLFTLQARLAKGTVEQQDAVVIGSEISRLDQILKDFQRLARPPEPRLTEIRAETLLREVQELMEPLLKQQSIQLKRESDEDVKISADPQQLKQVLINLVKNAAESIKHDGTITLRVRSDKPQLKGQPAGVVVLEVEDNGPGIPLEIQENIFDPFFSTKEQGTGLGLPIVARIVEKHGGALKFESKGDQGAIFRVELPVEHEIG
jgi:signal transduction histidine kinase